MPSSGAITYADMLYSLRTELGSTALLNAIRNAREVMEIATFRFRTG